MKIQLSAGAVILAMLATSAHADADHDYPQAATAGFSAVKHNADTSTSGSRAPGARASPGRKTREQAQQVRVSLNATRLCRLEMQTDPAGQSDDGVPSRASAALTRGGLVNLDSCAATHSPFLSSTYAISCVE